MEESCIVADQNPAWFIFTLMTSQWCSHNILSKFIIYSNLLININFKQSKYKWLNNGNLIRSLPATFQTSNQRNQWEISASLNQSITVVINSMFPRNINVRDRIKIVCNKSS